METSNNRASGSSSPAPSAINARRSRRVVRVPQKFVPDAPIASQAKRKRDAVEADDDDDREEHGLDHESTTENEPPSDDDSETATEQPKRKPRQRKTPAAQGGRAHPLSRTAKARKPASKKPKINGNPLHAANDDDDGAAPSPTVAAARLPSRPKKKAVRIAVSENEGNELFVQVFASGDLPEKVATDWYHKYREDSVTALRDFINCVLKCAGCDLQVSADDIGDVDNCQNRIADIQNMYIEEGITEYPLISRSRTTRSFRELLIGFSKAMITILHETDLLYKDIDLVENIHRWMASMSSSSLRAFRHTATTVCLAIMTALVEVSKKLDERVTKLSQQKDAEKNRRGKNKERLAAIQRDLVEANQSRDFCSEQMKDYLDTVFVHRYRDVDPKIRADCMEALGNWIWILPTVFVEPNHLRYMGWLLSDAVPQTRLEVLKQLGRIFKRDAEKLGHFIDRFRPRLVEMAEKDNDSGCRVATIGVLEALKDTGMLEPDELDSIGRLIFDTDLRVRRAVVDFFVGCVRDLIESKIDDMGGSDAVDDLFGDQDEDDVLSPRKSWIDVKCLAANLVVYDTQLDDTAHSPPRSLDIATERVQAAVPLTRISMATEVLAEKIEYVKQWETIIGYLLHDHTASANTTSNGKAESNDETIRDAVAPEPREELILLDILASVVKMSLAPSTDGDRTKKKPRLDTGENPEEMTVRLASWIPLLLKKFGAEPKAAVIILRLEHYLRLDVFEQLRQDSTTYLRLLDEVCEQFERHVDSGVIAEAAAALLHARRPPTLREVTDTKMSELWESVISGLRAFDQTCNLSLRNNLDAPALTELSRVLMKLSKLSAISDCIGFFEAPGPTADRDESMEGGSSTLPVLDILVGIVHRGRLSQVDPSIDDLEDEIVTYAAKACMFYFMWQLHGIIDKLVKQPDYQIPAAVITALNDRRKAYIASLAMGITTRGTDDDLRVYLASTLCDLHISFARLRQELDELRKSRDRARGKQPEGSAAAGGSHVKNLERNAKLLKPLLDPIPEHLVGELIEIVHATERTFARLTKKTLARPTNDEDLLEDSSSEEEVDDEDDEPELQPEGGGGGGAGQEGGGGSGTAGGDERTMSAAAFDARQRQKLKAEHVLCEYVGRVVMVVLRRMVDADGARRLRSRLLRNKGRLGSSHKEVLEYLDESKLEETIRKGMIVWGIKPASAPKKKGGNSSSNTKTADNKAKASKQPAKKAAAAAAAALSEEIVVSDEDEDEEGEHEGGGGGPNADEEEDPFASPPPAEGSAEDLRRRELVEDDPIEEVDEEDEMMTGAAGPRGNRDGEDDDDNSVIGD